MGLSAEVGRIGELAGELLLRMIGATEGRCWCCSKFSLLLLGLLMLLLAAGRITETLLLVLLVLLVVLLLLLFVEFIYMHTARYCEIWLDVQTRWSSENMEKTFFPSQLYNALVL